MAQRTAAAAAAERKEIKQGENEIIKTRDWAKTICVPVQQGIVVVVERGEGQARKKFAPSIHTP